CVSFCHSTFSPYFLCACSLFFNATSTTQIYTLSLHDALPISIAPQVDRFQDVPLGGGFLSLYALGGHECFEFQFFCAFLRFPFRSEETRLNSSHVKISYAVFCLKKKKK